METVACWEDLPPGEKQARLLDQALDRKREILSLPLPDADDVSAEATRLRSLILAASDSTINQTIALRSNTLAAAKDTHAEELEQFIEERRQKAVAMIARMWNLMTPENLLAPRGRLVMPPWPDNRASGTDAGC